MSIFDPLSTLWLSKVCISRDEMTSYVTLLDGIKRIHFNKNRPRICILWMLCYFCLTLITVFSTFVLHLLQCCQGQHLDVVII